MTVTVLSVPTRSPWTWHGWGKICAVSAPPPWTKKSKKCRYCSGNNAWVSTIKESFTRKPYTLTLACLASVKSSSWCWGTNDNRQQSTILLSSCSLTQTFGNKILTLCFTSNKGIVKDQSWLKRNQWCYSTAGSLFLSKQSTNVLKKHNIYLISCWTQDYLYLLFESIWVD